MQLKPVETGHDQGSRCMDGTRETILKRIMGWVSNPQERNETPQSDIYWIYGSPGVGKTSLAHSICASLQERKQLAGAFFCRRDAENLSDPRHLLSTFIHKLAQTFPHFRTIVAEYLQADPHLTPQSMKETLFVDFIRSVRRHPKQHPLVFVIDAFDECGNRKSRPDILKALIEAAALAPWLKIIITSRPELDIGQCFLGIPTKYDLGTDREANDDLRAFARREFRSVASQFHLSTWPEEPLFNRVISQANGLFIFIKTLVLALELCSDPEKSLEEILHGSISAGLEPLFGLYTGILKAQLISNNTAEFWQVVVLITTAQYRPLREETIAKLARVKPNLVGKWVDDLSSLIYRDEAADNAIRARHLSIIEYFVSDRCAYKANLQNAHAQLGIACLETMVVQLRFNICELEDSRVANAAIKDLGSRIEQKIPQPLQYSCLYWSNHLSKTPSNDHWQALGLGSLKKFIEGLYPLFWMEVLSVLGMVPIGAPSLRSILSWVKVSRALVHLCLQSEVILIVLQDADPMLLERIQDIYHFTITFHTPISISAPHTYVSTLPFLPSRSPLSMIAGTRFTKAIKVKTGKLLLWPTSPLEWIGHTDSVTCMSYSPNGCHIVTGSNDMSIRIWDAETGSTIGEPLKGHTDTVRSVGYSPDGRRIISGSGDSTIRIWDAETGAAVGRPLEGHIWSVASVCYSPDGRHISSGSYDKAIRIWDAETGAAIGQPLEGHTWSVTSISYSPNGRRIISGSEDKTIRIWDAETGAAISQPLEGHTDYVTSVAYSPDGRCIISGSYDKTIRIWDAETGAAIGQPLGGHTDYVTSVGYSPDGQRIISGSDDRTIQIWDAKTGVTIGQPLEGHTSSVTSVGYSPDGRHISSGSYDTTIRIWDAETSTAIGQPLEGHARSVKSVGYSPDGQRIISGSFDLTIRIWDAETGAPIGQSLEGHTSHVTSIGYSPDGRRIISGSNDKTIRIWDAETGAAISQPLEGHTSHVTSIAYSPNGQHIISGSHDNTIQIWDAETGATVGEPLEGHPWSVTSVGYSPDGKCIISGSFDSTIRIWDAETGVAISQPLEGHTSYVTSVCYSPNGQRIISGSYDKTIRIWDAETGAAVSQPLVGHTDTVRSVGYSPDGQYIISGSDDRTIRIWDAKTGVTVGQPLEGHTRNVTSVGYSPNGRHIVSGSDDRTIRIWDAETGAAIVQPLEGHTSYVTSVGSSPDGQGIISGPDGSTIQIWGDATGAAITQSLEGRSHPAMSDASLLDGRHSVTGSDDATIHRCNSIPHCCVQCSFSRSPLHPDFCTELDPNGWVRDSNNGLLYWVPPDCRSGLHSPAVLTIPLTSHIRSISLDFSDFAFGSFWTQIFRSP